MVELKGSRFTSLLPSNLAAQPETQALAYAFSRQLDRVLEYAARVEIFCSIDTQPAEVLDYLAVELRTPCYNSGLTLDAKRDLVKNTLLMYYSSATPHVVNLIIQSVFKGGKISEWHEYGGEPHYFKIDAPASGALDGSEKEALVEAVNSVKRLSSWMESVATTSDTAAAAVYTACAAGTVMRTTLPPVVRQYYFDTADELARVNNPQLGTTAVIAATGDVYAADSNGTWHEI